MIHVSSIHRPALVRGLLGATLLLGTTATVQAQNVSLKGDVIMVDKKPYGKLTKSGGLLKDFTLLTLDDQEVMTAKGNIVQLPSNETFIYYTLTFKPGGETAEMSKDGMNFAAQMATALVANEVLRDGKPNAEGIARFVDNYGKKLSEKYAAENEAQKNAKPLEYKTVERNRMGGGPQLVTNRRTPQRLEIMQGGKLIGYLNLLGTEKGRANATVTLPDGLNVADLAIEAWQADSPGARDMGYKMLVKKDNKYHTRSVVGGVSTAQQDAIDYLVTGGYL